MKIAFATSDSTFVDEQFRRASNLVVYEITGSGHRLDRICAFPKDRSVKTQQRIEAILGVSVVYVSAIGPSSAARLAAHGIRPATLPAGTSIAKVLSAFESHGRDPACRA
jgi:predicted Fe-Mo cluster-binding NifX family protein